MNVVEAQKILDRYRGKTFSHDDVKHWLLEYAKAEAFIEAVEKFKPVTDKLEKYLMQRNSIAYDFTVDMRNRAEVEKALESFRRDVLGEK